MGQKVTLCRTTIISVSTTNWHLPRTLPMTEQQRHLPSASREMEPHAAIPVDLHVFIFLISIWCQEIMPASDSPSHRKELGHNCCVPLLLSSNSHCLLHNRSVSQETSCCGKEYWCYLKSQQTKTMVDQCPKEPLTWVRIIQASFILKG